MGIIIQTSAIGAPKISIIIDDMGYHLTRGMQALSLKGPITYSFLPYQRYSAVLNREAHLLGKGVMLHAPMETLGHLKLGRGGLDNTMSSHTFIQTLEADLGSLPYVDGVNNHMGSALTQSAAAMQLLMAVLQTHQLYFIDSRTTHKTIAERVARDNHIPTLHRHVFLDNVRTTAAIDKEYKRLLRIAKKHGYAIAIAHPHDVTIKYLKKKLPYLPRQGYELVPVSELLHA